AGLFKVEQGRVQRALFEGQLMAADLLDAPGDAITVQGAERLERLEDHQTQAAIDDVALLMAHRWTAYIYSGRLSTHVLGSLVRRGRLRAVRPPSPLKKASRLPRGAVDRGATAYGRLTGRCDRCSASRPGRPSTGRPHRDIGTP